MSWRLYGAGLPEARPATPPPPPQGPAVGAALPAAVDLARLATWAAAFLMLLIYSQAFLLPVFGGGEDQGGIQRLAFLPAYALGLVLLASAPLNALRGALRQPFLLLLVAVAVASIAWSAAPMHSARQAFALVFTVVSGVALAARFDWTDLAELAAAALLTVAIGSALAAVLAPELGVAQNGDWRGLWLEGAGLGGRMALAVPVLFAAGVLAPQRRAFWWGGAALGACLVLLSQARPALLAVLLAGGVAALTALIRRDVPGRWRVLAAGGVLILAAALSAESLLGAVVADPARPGRAALGAAALRQIAERPWLGLGYQAVWNDAAGWGPFAWLADAAGFKARHAHNSWLEHWLGVGVVGLAALGLFLVQNLVLAGLAMFRLAGAWLAAPYLSAFALLTLTDSLAAAPNDLRWALLVAISTRLVLPDQARGAAE